MKKIVKYIILTLLLIWSVVATYFCFEMKATQKLKQEKLESDYTNAQAYYIIYEEYLKAQAWVEYYETQQDLLEDYSELVGELEYYKDYIDLLEEYYEKLLGD